jgi:CheY-like chemotaxis protein
VGTTTGEWANLKKIGQVRDRSSGRRRHRVLYVEDNDDNWSVIELRLGASYELLRAASDREACEILSQPLDLYAILMDVELAGSKLNGVQLTQLIRGKLPERERPAYAANVPKLDVPVLFVTAYAASYAHARLIEAGADSVLAKPIDFTRLNLALTKLFINRALDRP